MGEKAQEIVTHATQQSSVALSTNAKGQLQFEIKVYADDAPAAAEQAIKIVDRLRGAYLELRPPTMPLQPEPAK